MEVEEVLAVAVVAEAVEQAVLPLLEVQLVSDPVHHEHTEGVATMAVVLRRHTKQAPERPKVFSPVP